MRYGKLLENLEQKVDKSSVSYRRYNLSELISESHRACYECEGGTNLHKIAEAQIKDIRNNPRDTERLSRQLSNIKNLISLVESGKVKDEELLVPEEKYDTVEPKEKKVEEAKEEGEVEKVEEAHGPDSDKEDILEDTELTDEEIEALSKHLEEIRKNKKVEETTQVEEEPSKKVVREGRKLRKKVVELEEDKEGRVFQYGIDILQGEGTNPVDTEEKLRKLLSDAGYDVVGCMSTDTSWSKKEYGLSESRSWGKISLKEFSKKSAGKAFMKTFKKMDTQLKEGTALTRQEAIALYKAANSAMTHLSVELEHNPGFLPVFKESVSLLSADVAQLLESMKNDKAPSKATMKSLAKFSEALLREDDEEELPPIEDEDDEIIAPEEEVETSEVDEEEEKFDQDYAEARIEAHKEMVEEHGDDENPEVQEKLAQDAEEILDLPGITPEQAEEIRSEDIAIPDADADAVVEESEKKDIVIDDADITDEEMEQLKKYLKEMRESKNNEVSLKDLNKGDKFSKNGYNYTVKRVDGDGEDITVHPEGDRNPEDDINTDGSILMRGTDKVIKRD